MAYETSPREGIDSLDADTRRLANEYIELKRKEDTLGDVEARRMIRLAHQLGPDVLSKITAWDIGRRGPATPEGFEFRRVA